MSAIVVLNNGHVIAGGRFDTAGGVSASRIALWNGAAWSQMGSGLSSGSVEALAALPNGHVIAGGDFTAIAGSFNSRIARWNGAAWHPLGAGMGGVANPTVTELAVMPNGDVVAGGEFLTAGGVSASHVARWNGTAWSALGSGSTYAVTALCVLPNGDLAAAGSFGGQGEHSVAVWDGGSWVYVSRFNPTHVDAMAVDPAGHLVVGGSFLFIDGVPAPKIASWDGSVWHHHGTGLEGLNRDVRALLSLPGGIAAAGNTSIAGGHVSAGWAEARCICYPDCDGDGVLSLADFGCFQTKFGLGDPYADCDGDGLLTLADFGCFQTGFGLGCP